MSRRRCKVYVLKGVCWWLCVCYLTWHGYPSLVDRESRGILYIKTCTFTFQTSLYPEWPHRQCVGLAFRCSRVRFPVAAASLVICDSHLHQAIRTLCRVVGNDQSILSKSLTLLSVAGCRRLQLGAPHWATSVLAVLQVVDNWPHIMW